MHNLKSLDVVFDVEKFAVPAFAFASAVANLFYAKTGSNNFQEGRVTHQECQYNVGKILQHKSRHSSND